MNTVKSERELVQEKLVQFLTGHSSYFNAPYGILAGLDPIKGRPGKVRSVTFGVARYLDANVNIWSTQKLTLSCQGPLVGTLGSESTFDSIDSLIEHLKSRLTL